MWWWIVSAMAAPPDGLRPVVAPFDVQAQHDAFRAERGLATQTLACRPLWPRHASLCFRVWDGGARRWVVRADLARWGTDVDGLRDQVQPKAAARLSEAEVATVDGMASTFLKHVDGDGWAAAGVLDPPALAARLGGPPIRVAVPSGSVLLAWKAGDTALDTVMAIGVTELYEQQAGGVAPNVFTWDGEEWRSFGVARAKSEPQTPDPK